LQHKNSTSLNTLQDLVKGLEQRHRKPALMHLRKSGHQTYTFALLFRLARQRTGDLIQKGIEPGDIVGLFGPLDAAWIAACLGTLRAGGVVMPLDLQLDSQSLSKILADSQPRFLFTHSGQWSRLQQMVPTECIVYFIDKAVQEPKGPTKHPAENQTHLPEIRADQTAALFYTSGTTGPPKGVPLTHGNLAFQIRKVQETQFLKPDDRVLLPLPAHHVYPFVIGMLAPLFMGATIVLPYSLTGPQIVRSLREGDITLLFGVPRLYQAMFDNVAQKFESHAIINRLFEAALTVSPQLGRKSGFTPIKWLFTPLRRWFAPHLRILASGGAPLSGRLAQHLETLGWQVAIGYGLTETAPLVTLKLPGDPHHDTVGPPVDGVDLRIDSSVIPDSDHNQGKQQEGEILTRGPNVFSGYYHLPHKTEAVFTPDGWFRTGDLGYLDAEGYLHLTGRVSTLMVTQGGEKVQPDSIETHLLVHPLIREVGVFQQKDGTLTAVVVPEMNEITDRGIQDPKSAIQEAIRKRSQELPSYQHIHDVALTHAPLPRTRLGKIRRHRLEKIFQEVKTQQTSLPSDQVGPVSPDDMSVQDRTLLDTPEVSKAWNWLTRRYSDHRLSPDSRLELDLGVDSMEWLNLTLEIHHRTGIELDEEDISEVVTVRDLLRTLARKTSEGEIRSLESPLEDPEQVLTPKQNRWLQPTGTAEARVARILFVLIRKVTAHMFKLSIRGARNVPAKGPFIITPNHVSYLDAFAVAAALDLERLRRIYWAGFTGAAFRNVFFRYFSRLSRTIPIDPDHGILSGMALAAKVLHRNQGLVWFPEGQRSPDGTLQSFKSGIGLLLSYYPVPVIPVFVRGTETILPPGRIIPRPGRIQVAFGSPISPEKLVDSGKGEEKMDRITSALQKEVARLGNTIRNTSREKPL